MAGLAQQVVRTFALGAGFGLTFFAGWWISRSEPARAQALPVERATARAVNPDVADARLSLPSPQGRGTRPDRKKPIGDTPKTGPAAPLVYGGDSGGTAAAANGILAVTGSYGVGTSVLFVIDTESKQLAVYEARGGSPNRGRVFLVGARRIDLDLTLRGYHDESEWKYDRLRKRFAEEGLLPKSPSEGSSAASASDRSGDPSPRGGR